MLLRCCTALLLLGCELKSGTDCNGCVDAGTTDSGVTDSGTMDSGPGDAGGDASSDAGPPVIVGLAAGGQHNCVVFSDGALYCWGANGQEQLGPGGGSSVRLVTGVPPMAEVCGGGAFTCAMASEDGSVWCWGDNEFSQLGSTGAAEPGPHQVSLVRRALHLFCGDQQACIIDGRDELHCWGYGMAINGSAAAVAPPMHVDVAAGGPVRDVALGFGHTCAIVGGGGEVYCWGQNTEGQISDPVSPPVSGVDALARDESLGTLDVAAGGTYSCRTSPGGTECWGPDAFQVSATPTSVVFSTIEAGTAHTCGLDLANGVVCWGDNTDGQLGVIALTDLFEPEVAARLLAAGASHTCALDLDGEVYCWGSNLNGAVNGIPMNEHLAPTLIQLPP